MPSFELFFITKRLSKTDLVSCLKRTAEMVWDSNGILRKIENLGTRNLPFAVRTPIQGQRRYRSGNFFLFHCDVPPLAIRPIRDNLKMDTDLMKVFFCAKENKIPKDYVCTLEEELKPPSFRPSVQALIKRNDERIEKSYLRITNEDKEFD